MQGVSKTVLAAATFLLSYTTSCTGISKNTDLSMPSYVQTKQFNAKDDYESEAEEYHHFQSDKLNHWVEKARKQASDITAQALKDTGGIVREASKGILNGVGQILIYFFIINIIFLLVKSC